jgi:hypothetical protein
VSWTGDRRPRLSRRPRRVFVLAMAAGMALHALLAAAPTALALGDG